MLLTSYTEAGQRIGAYVVAAQAATGPIPAPSWEMATLAGFVTALAGALYAELKGSKNDWKKQAQDGTAELAKANDALKIAADVAERQNRALLDVATKMDRAQSDITTILRYLEDDRRRKA